MQPSSPTHRQTISAILIDAGAVTSEQVDLAIERHRETGCRIGEALVQLGFVSEEDIGWALARQLGIPFVDVRLEMLDVEFVRSFPDGALRRLQAVPLFRAEGRVTAAVADPTDHEAIAELERLCDEPASCVAATPSAIGRALDAMLGHAHSAHARHAEAKGPLGIGVLWERSGESFLNFQISEALRLGAQEIHFACANSWLYVRHRSGTKLATVSLEPAAVMDVLLTRFEALGMKPLGQGDEHRAFATACRTPELDQDIRVSVLAGADGVTAAVRLLGAASAAPRLEALGLEALDVAQLRAAVLEPSGLVFVCGPTGSGGSTTLAALLAEQPKDERRWAVFARDGWRATATSGTADVVAGALASRWPRIAAAHDLDGAIVDGGLEGERVAHVLDGAAQGRWTLARTDWEDTFEMLAWLTQQPGGRSALARRLRAVIQQRLVAVPAAHAAAGTPAPARAAVFEVLFPGDALRDALRSGAGAAELRAIAASEGWHPLHDTLEAGVKSGKFDPRDAARAVA